MCHTYLRNWIAPLSVLLVVSVPTQAADWARWRGPDANGISQETGWKAWSGEPKILWKAKLGIGFSSITVSEGRAYSMGNQKNAAGAETDTLHCFDAEKGTPLWSFSYPAKLDPNLYEGGPNATPTVADGQVFILSREGQAFCLDAAKGTLVWSNHVATTVGAQKPDWGFSSSVYLEGDLAIVNVGAAGTALNRKTGEVVWKSGTEKAGYSTALPFDQDGKRLVLIFGATDLNAVQMADGRLVWSHPWKTQYGVNAADPVIISPTELFLSSGYNYGGGLVKLTAGKPTEVWKNKNMRNQLNSSVRLGDYVYGYDEAELRCLAWGTGEVKWSEKSMGKGSLIMADGKLIALSEKGELVIADATPEAFKPSARGKILNAKCWTAPTLANGRIYARDAAGELVCVDVSGK